MQLAPIRRVSKSVRQGVAVFSLGIFLLLEAMAAVPALHTLVHKDSADPDHQCAVTFFTHGQAHYSETLVEPSRAVLLVLQRAPVPATIFVSRDLRFLPCRGPPARFASI